MDSEHFVSQIHGDMTTRNLQSGTIDMEDTAEINMKTRVSSLSTLLLEYLSVYCKIIYMI